MSAAETLGIEGLRQVPRALGLMDRDRTSPTYGCADRYYWHYKLHDLVNSRFQEVSELLALAFLYRRPGNTFAGVDRVREWAVAALRYWERLRRCDGTYDEVYPFERSFCATAFSAMHATEAFLLLGERPTTDLVPVGRWLARHDAPDVANQRAASAVALANLGTLLGVDAFLAAARARVASLVESCERSGHLNEYGGRDVGYTSITLSALAAYARRSGAEIQSWLRSQADSLGGELDDRGRYRLEGQSRATQFFYPSALAWAKSPALEKLVVGIREDLILKPSWMDDRYSLPYAVDYLRAAAR